MIHFVGAGPGAPDLITRRGAALLQAADCIIYAGSLVNPALLGLAREDCAVYNSAEMTLEQVLAVMRQMEAAGRTTVRLHTGDPCLYGAIREQMDVLDAEGIPYDDTPGVSSFCGAAAALNAEYTLPTVSQTGRPCRPWGDHGDLFVHRPCGKGAAGASGGRSLHAGYPGSGGVQGHMAGRTDRPLHCGHAGGKRSCSGHHQNGAHRGG